MVEYPFNLFFVKLLIYTKNIFNDFFGKTNAGSVPLQAFEHKREELSMLVDYINDFCSIECSRLQRLLLNISISFMLLPLVRNLIKKNDQRIDRYFLLFFTVILPKLQNNPLKLTFYKIIFDPAISCRLNDSVMFDNQKLEASIQKYSVKTLIESNSQIVKHQLYKLYEKIVLNGVEPKSSISLQEVLKEKIDFPSSQANSDDKLFHLEYTQKTGMISYLEWSTHLEHYAFEDPVSLVEDATVLDRNSIRTYLIVCLNVS